MATPRRIAIALEIDQPYPQHQDVFAGVQRFARERGNWQCVIDEHPGLHPQRRGALYGRYDGAIARATEATQKRLKRLGTPLVNVHYQTIRHGTYGVYPDPDAVGQIAADHLIDRGFRRLVAFSDRGHKHSLRISAAFKAHAEERGAGCELFHLPETTYLDSTFWLELERMMNRVVEDVTPPIAMFLEASAAARLMIQQCLARGLNVPQDVAVLCQYDLSAIVDVPPQISSVSANYERVGYEAARLLERLMSGETVSYEPVLVPPRQVIARESTDFFAVEDPLVAAALRHISANLTDPLRIEEIAYALAVSPRQLQLRFGKALGRGVSDEIRRLRLTLVKRLLIDPERSIGEIAAASGFGRPQLLCAVFRRELGMTPSEYRQMIDRGRNR